MSQTPPPEEPGQDGDSNVSAALPQPPQTPLFRATQADRYRRQEQIKAIEAATGRTLICYISGPAGLTYTDVDEAFRLGSRDLTLLEKIFNACAIHADLKDDTLADLVTHQG